MKEKMAIGGSIISAFTASLCCIGPLLFLALGIGGFTASRFFETWRPYLLGLTFSLLGVAFYRTYRKPEDACDEGKACSTGTPRIGKWNKIVLWVATVFVVAFAAFPYYAGSLSACLSRSQGNQAIASGTKGEASLKLPTVVIKVNEMTCGGCAGVVKASLEKVSGVKSAVVSFEKAEARVEYNPSEVTIEKLVEAIDQAGYKASLPK